jgi:Putative polyhydroxyalkanoic acid system protein (PHA_gran_rgn)
MRRAFCTGVDPAQALAQVNNMAEPLVISIAHKLGKDEALRRIKPALGKASANFPVLSVDEEKWSGDGMDFRVRALGQAASGNVQVTDDHVRLEVTLPWLLHKFGEAVQKTIRDRGRVLLEKK